jgi:HK97 family phage major capsid protein
MTVKTEKGQVELRSILNRALRGQELAVEEREVLSFTDLGIEAPSRVKTELLDSKRPYKSMKQFVHVIPVTREVGRYTTEDESQVGELFEFDTITGIPYSDVHIKGILWETKPRGSLTSIGSSHFHDAAFDLVQMIRRSHGRKAVKTENKLIFAKLREGIVPGQILEQALYDSLDTDLDPSLEKEITIVTNQDGLKKIKNFADYKVIETANGIRRFLDIYPIECFSNGELPNIDNGDTTFSAPIFYGSFNQSIKFFDHQTVDIAVSTATKFNQDLHVLRGIESFDVQKHGTGTPNYKYNLIKL